MLTITPGALDLETLAHLSDGFAALRHHAPADDRIATSAATVRAAAEGDAPVYGVNTGFGKLASVRIPAADTAALQRNLILSHCAGVGEPVAEPVARLMMALKIASLARGASGVRPEVITQLETMLSAGVTPVVPAQGSVGASGDLAPLAHMAAVMMGEGEATHQGRRMAGAEALQSAGIAPLALGAKEGLALINGTQFSTALALTALFEAHAALIASLATGALSTDAAMGSAAPFRPEIHALRGQPGQIDCAATLRALMTGSEIRESHREDDERVQDPYCLRCQPQVTGACLDVLRACAATLVREANAVTDNPLVLSDGAIVSGGNFHAEPVALAADQIALAVAETGSIAQRRIAMLVDPALNFGLPPFLTPEPGLNSGFMIAEVTSAALMSENKQLAAPASVDSTPTSANQEDHVSMAAHAAHRLLRMCGNLRQIVGIEALVAAQGVEMRGPLRTAEPLARVVARIRADIPALGADRYIAPDLAAAATLVRHRELVAAAGRKLFPPLASQGTCT